ncbi:MAG: GWxTD domain-containing protein [Gracilimonas sp.]|nr:GWxTD domain-containing protein [Gracilimonas sp.]
MRKHILTIFLLAGISGSLFAQRVTYPQLVARSQAPEIFIEDLILPGNDSLTTLAFIFRFNNDFIPFKKLPVNHKYDLPAGAEFYSTIRLNAEIFEGKIGRKQQNSMNSVTRDYWADTLHTQSFEETQSRKKYASGFLRTELPAGKYNFVLQLAMMQEVNERNTQRQNIRIPDLSKSARGEVYLIRNVVKAGEQQEYVLMNMEKNVVFGKDFHVMIRIPQYENGEKYTLKIHRARVNREDTTSAKEIYSSELKQDDLFFKSVALLKNNQQPSLTLSNHENGYTYAVHKIPANTFENAGYILTVENEGTEKPVARRFFSTYWADMPASLYNLDIAIEHLKYIIPEKEIERINRGNSREREQKFRAFWDEKDPTPNTVYNELMAEYYRRIDYAYNEFGSQENPMGHENDQGEVYIKFGPPKNKERRFPERNRTLEVWEYPNRTFIFEATTGFGDFKLVSTK